jgi:tRNA 2-thiouridine synthesizing protein A
MTEMFAAIGSERGDLNFRAAEIDANAKLAHRCRMATRPGLLKRREAAQDARMGERVLDVKDLKCPLPVLRANRELRGMQPGERLRVLATDRAAVADFQSYCRETGHALLAWSEEGEVFSFLIRRRAEEPAKPDEGT